MNRRDLLKGTLAAGAAIAVPAAAQALPAVPMSLNPRDRRLVAVAQEQLARKGGGLWARDVVGIADFGLRSDQPRFHLVNMESGHVDSFRCAHGMGSDPEHDGWLKYFSNVHESWCTSRGAYMTFGWYTGKYGTSIRLEGRDPSNSNALSRAIVMHRASYAEPSHLSRFGKLGRSNGCFAFSDADFKLMLLRLAGGRLLFADKLGIGPYAETVSEPRQDLRLLVPQGAPQPPPAPGSF
ncbi:twin-arginine translocation signal domain-containing protein [Altererythrobacter aerius]|uniref:Twin-arginine translocation signal domain-containing protein n=1 Tax=Tsuneonella aeria TaxID=1837929 RepID=A0A6I4TFS9_9SPHN|nr:murein L,D-transpeptidase catalytic domain family protein [Tsuneonella aeria]MXO74985.1 twin-arginine translocation signal domain-containing protein [Tsuneonella aeria]